MSKNKETAVEWLIDRLNQHGFLGMYCEESQIDVRKFAYNEIIELAKNIERQQHEQLYFEATKYACSCYEGPTKEDFEEDYKDIFENK